MPGFAEKISEQVRRDTSHHLIYPPGVPLELGDIVERQAGIWVPIGNIAADLGIKVDTKVDPIPDNWEPASERGYESEIKVAGQPAPTFKVLVDADAGVKVTLKGQYAFVLSMAGVQFERIRSIDAFWSKVKAERGFWTWDLSRRIVSRVVRVKSATFLASGAQEASFELRATAALPAGPVTAAELAAGFTLASTMSGKDRFVAQAGATPLFGAHRVKLFGGLGGAETTAGTLDESVLEHESEST